MSKWYDDWIAKENNMPVNFGKYIGNVKGADPGATNAGEVLYKAHLQLKSKVGISERTPEELQQLSAFLTAIFFGNNLENDNNVTTRFLNTVIKAYSDVYKEEIQMAEGFGGDITKSKTFSTGQILDKMKQIEKDKKSVQNRCLNTIHKEIVEIETILKSIDIKQLKTETIKRKMQKIYENYDTIVMLYSHQAGNSAEAFDASDFDSQWANIKSKMLIKDGLIEDLISLDKIKKGDGLKGTRANLIKTLNEFETYCMTLKKLALVTPATYGNVFEFGLALVNNYTEVIGNNAELLTAKELKQISKEFIKGNKSVERGGAEYSISVDVNKIFDEEISKYDSRNTFLKNMAVFKDGVTEIDNISFSTDGLDGVLRTNEEKQAKVDVLLTAPDAAGDIVKGQQFKVSAKNWGAIDTSHNLGETTFLRGIDRTVGLVSSKEEALLNYIYVMQHPVDGERIPDREREGDPQERRNVAKTAIHIGHQLAKESLMLDIATGLSQKSNSADTLIIMDRQKKRVIVIDLISEMKKYLEGTKSSLFLEGYDEDNIESSARAFRTAVRKNISYVGRDRNYVSLMKLYLNSKKATVKLSPEYIKSIG